MPLIRSEALHTDASICTSVVVASSGRTGTPSIEIVVGENAKTCPPASISVVGVFAEHEKGPLILAIVPFGNEAVPETVDVDITYINKQIDTTNSRAKPIAIATKIERSFES